MVYFFKREPFTLAARIKPEASVTTTWLKLAPWLAWAS